VVWVRDGRGSPFRTVRIDPQFAELAIDGSLQQFRRLFRREPGQHDRFSPEAYVVDGQEFKEEFARAATKAGVDPSLIYAFQKTGRIIVDGLTPPLPQQYVGEWEEAVEEYHEIGDLPPAPPNNLDHCVAALMDEAVRLPYIFGKLLVDVSERPPAALRSMGFPGVFALFCATRAAKTLRAIRLLVDTQAGEDTLTLVRSIYEGYLHCVGVLTMPDLLEEVQRAKSGIDAGTHIHPATRNGRPNYRIALSIATGQRLRSDLSMRALAAGSPHDEDLDIYENLYSYLSEFAHPHILAMPYFVGPGGFTTKSRDLAFESFLLSILMATMVLDAIVQLPLPRDTRADMMRFLRHAKKAFSSFFAEAHRLESPSSFHLSLQRRAFRLGKRWPTSQPV
jgi:hypothetical protein